MSVHLARGTRDFLPDAASRRHFVVNTVAEAFARHGFEPLITPAIERIETLTGKYGDEGQKLMFKILKRGAGAERGECDLALRYDLTVPLARVVAMNPGLRLPFKRWQAAPVWRAEKPGRGRFREFLQCDADIVGADTALADAQCVAVVIDALTTLGFDNMVVRLNDRRLLRALARAAGAEADREVKLLVAVDKLDKIGRDGVDAELAERGFDEAQRARVWKVLDLEGDNATLLEALETQLEGEEVSQAATRLREVLALAEALGTPPERIRVDPTLARGLDYYTGPVFEVAVTEPDIGSIGAGGRYDNLVGVFGKQDVPAVGASLGIDRILVVMEELGMFPESTSRPDVLVTVYDPSLQAQAAKVAGVLRAGGVRTDLYLGSSSMKSQFKLADARGIPFVAVIGPAEAELGKVALKNMADREQQVLTPDEVVRKLRDSASTSPS